MNDQQKYVPSQDDSHLPELPHPRMPLTQRAKIFIPFDPLKGYQEALREKEREAERDRA